MNKSWIREINVNDNYSWNIIQKYIKTPQLSGVMEEIKHWDWSSNCASPLLYSCERRPLRQLIKIMATCTMVHLVKIYLDELVCGVKSISCDINNRQFDHLHHLLHHSFLEEVIGDIIKCQSLSEINALHKKHVTALHIRQCFLCLQCHRNIALGQSWQNSFLRLYVVFVSGIVGVYIKCNSVICLVC